MFEKLFKEKQFIEPKDLEAAKILSKTKQWQERVAGSLKCFRAGKKILYSQTHIADYLSLCEQGRQTNGENQNMEGE